MNTFVPVEPFPPGEYLQDELDARGLTQDDLSKITGITRRQIQNIIKGKSGITAETAIAIAAAFDQNPETWMRLQASYELASAKVEQQAIEKRAQLYARVPVREIVRRGWINDSKDPGKLEEEVCQFLRIEKIADQPTLGVAARKSSEYTFTNAAQLAWYFRVRQVGEVAPASSYSPDNIESGISDLVALAENPEDVRRVPKVLSDMGIRLVLVEHLKKSKIDGVAMWLDKSSPVIGLSLRYDRMDNFWFSLLHELDHIKHKDESPVDVDLGIDADDLPEMEKRANSAAAAALVEPEALQKFILRCAPLYYEKRVVQFARSVNIHPSIVVGQLQNRGELNWSQLTKLKEKVAHLIKGQALTDGWGNPLDMGVMR